MTLNDRIEALLLAAREPAIALAREFPPRPYRSASSRAGGLPNLPDGIDWPRAPATGKPLHFLAQIDLAELPRVSPLMPEGGCLFFFARIDDEMLFDDAEADNYRRVIFTDEMGSTPREMPADLSEMWWPIFDHRKADVPDLIDCRIYPCARLVARQVDSYASASLLGARDGDLLTLYERQAERLRVQSAAEAFGIDTQALLALRPFWGEFPFYGDDPSQRIIPPDFDKPFPQCWRMVAWFARGIIVGSTSRNRPERLPIARDWLSRALSKPPADAVPDGERQQFRKWLEELATDRISDVHHVAERAMRRVYQELASAPELIDRFPAEYLETWAIKNQAVACEGLRNKTLRTFHHQMLGHAPASQEPARGIDDDKVLLLQLVSDPGTDFMFCDLGEIEFTISRNDLAARRFDRVAASTAGG